MSAGASGSAAKRAEAPCIRVITRTRGCERRSEAGASVETCNEAHIARLSAEANLRDSLRILRDDGSGEAGAARPRDAA